MSEEKQYRTIPNRWVSMQLDATTQLTYVPLVNPAPLTASVPGNDPVLGSLEVVITNQTGATLQVSQIDFNIQIGSGASLTPSTASMLYAISDTSTWSISGPSSPVTDGIATYSVTPAQGLSASLANGAALVVLIYDFQTNTTPGTSTVGIVETIGSDVNDSSFQVTTFPSSFFFNSLTVTILQGSNFVAVAQIPFNTNVSLFWNASVVDPGSVRIMQSTVNGQQTFTPTIVNEWTTPTPIQTDTIFTVQITTTATPGGVPLIASLSTSVAVQTPALVASTLTVNGASTLTGAVTAGALTTSALNISGPVVAGTVTAGEISASVYSAGSISTGTLNATGTATMAGATVSGPVVAGTVSAGEISASMYSAGSIFTGTINTTESAGVAGGLTVQGVATLQGGLNALGGALAMLTPAQSIDTGSYTASTDGFVIGTIGYPITLSTEVSLGTVFGTIDGMTCVASGGYVGFFAPGNYCGPIMNSFCMPIRKGADWRISVGLDNNNQINPSTQFFWIPTGTTSSSESLVRHGDAEPPKEFKVTPHRRVAVPQEHLIDELADIIDSLVDKPMPPATRSHLREVLTKMNSGEYPSKSTNPRTRRTKE